MTNNIPNEPIYRKLSVPLIISMRVIDMGAYILYRLLLLSVQTLATCVATGRYVALSVFSYSAS